MSAWSAYWLIGWGVIGFLAPEAAAIVLNRHSDAVGKPRQHRTLTENVRALFATDTAGVRGRYRGLRRTALLASLAWLVTHFLTNGYV